MRYALCSLRINQLSGGEGWMAYWAVSGGVSFIITFSDFFLPVSFTLPDDFSRRVLAWSLLFSFFLFLLLAISRSRSLLGIETSRFSSELGVRSQKKNSPNYELITPNDLILDIGVIDRGDWFLPSLVGSRRPHRTPFLQRRDNPFWSLPVSFLLPSPHIESPQG